MSSGCASSKSAKGARCSRKPESSVFVVRPFSAIALVPAASREKYQASPSGRSMPPASSASLRPGVARTSSFTSEKRSERSWPSPRATRSESSPSAKRQICAFGKTFVKVFTIVQ
jgi:hypothetical protein